MIALNDIKFIPYLYYKRCVLTETVVGTNHQEFTHLTQMLADMRKIPFYFHKKTGMSKISDSGIAEILLCGQGLSITAHIVSVDRDQTLVFRIKDVQTSIQTLKFAIRDSKHDTLYKMLMEQLSHWEDKARNENEEEEEVSRKFKVSARTGGELMPEVGYPGGWVRHAK